MPLRSIGVVGLRVQESNPGQREMERYPVPSALPGGYTPATDNLG